MTPFFYSAAVGIGTFSLAVVSGMDIGTMFSAQLAMFASVWPVLLRHERKLSEVLDNT